VVGIGLRRGYTGTFDGRIGSGSILEESYSGSILVEPPKLVGWVVRQRASV
jgi:hypothetical protein